MITSFTKKKDLDVFFVIVVGFVRFVMESAIRAGGSHSFAFRSFNTSRLCV